MSAHSPEFKPTESRAIPSKRIVVNDVSQLPTDYSTTPGGTIFSTTPGGSRIIYDRNFLLQMRNSPVAKTPPKNLPAIPGVTVPLSPEKSLPKKPKENGTVPPAASVQIAKSATGDEPQFAMDI